MRVADPGYDGGLGRLVYAKEACRYLGVSERTLARYIKAGRLSQIKNTVNGRIYYAETELLGVLGSRLPQTLEVVGYCRAAVLGSRSDEGNSAKLRLSQQTERVTDYCAHAGIRLDRIISDVGAAHSIKGRPGIDQLMELVLMKKVSMVVVDSPDRIARFFMAEVFERFLTWHGVKLHVINNVFQIEEYREELKQDLAGILFESKKILGE